MDGGDTFAGEVEVGVLLFVPCRTAMLGQFPLNGTYFQTNEVFLDHASAAVPITVSLSSSVLSLQHKYDKY